MKKKIALLSVLGVAGGLIYALETQHRRKQATAAAGEDRNESSGSKDPAAQASRDNDRNAGRAASMAKAENGNAVPGSEDVHVLDDQGTGQSEASSILRNVRDQAFEASDEKLALALGRPTEEIAEWTSGNGLIDGDVVMKARALATQRGFEI